MQRGFIFDLDGTIYLDNELINGADSTIELLKNRGDKVVFLTNKSIAKRTDYVEKLRGLGIETNLDEVINSNYITARYLSKNLGPDEHVFVIGEKPLVEELQEQNISITSDPLEASYVVLGWDREFDYEKLTKGFLAWRNGATIIATNPDATCPVKDGEIPDCGAMIGAFEGATGEPVKLIAGKPSRMMAEYVVNDVLGLNPDQCYVVGDRLETDIRMANENHLNSILVLTGVTSKEDLTTSDVKPDYILNSVADIKNLVLTG